MRDTFLKRRGLMTDLLNEIPGMENNTPDGAFYMFPRVSAFFGKSYNGTAINNSDDLAEYIMAEGHVATVSGAAFGSPECIRLSYAASDDDLREAVKRIKNALAKLQ
jgi:aspartate aminotransferase